MTTQPIGTCPECGDPVLPDQEHVQTPALEFNRYMHTSCIPDDMADELIRPTDVAKLLQASSRRRAQRHLRSI